MITFLCQQVIVKKFSNILWKRAFTVIVLCYNYCELSSDNDVLVVSVTMIWPLIVVSTALLVIVHILRKILKPKIVEYCARDGDVYSGMLILVDASQKYYEGIYAREIEYRRD